MEPIVYIKSLHRPYNQNLNSIKWVCKFIKDKNSNNEISKSEFYVEFYIYFIEKFYKLYIKNSGKSLTHGIPLFDSVKNSYETINGMSIDGKKKIINESLSKRSNDFERSIYSTYKATSYFINLAKGKLEFVDRNNKLKDIGEILVGFRSNNLKLSKKEKEVLFKSIIKMISIFLFHCHYYRKFRKKQKI